MRVAVYSRKSVNTGKGDSIENQVKICCEYINKKFEYDNIDFKIYEDNGFSGKNINRPSIKRLYNDIDKNLIDIVICYKLDRISRSVVDFSNLITFLNKRKISFISVKDDFDTSTPMGRAMMYIISVFAQLERESISERVKDNMLEMAKNGKWLGGTTPLGYDAVLMSNNGNSYYTLKENNDINIVKLIFQMYYRYRSLNYVCILLADKNIYTRKGKRFTSVTLKNILKNCVYAQADNNVAKYLQSKKYTVFINEKGKGLISYNKTGDTPIAATGSHLGIIESKIWTEIQYILDSSQKHNFTERNRVQSYFSGKLYCGICGGKMYAKSRYCSNDFDYICKNKQKYGKNFCNSKNVCGSYVDKMIINTMLSIINYDNTDSLIDIKKEVVLSKEYNKNVLKLISAINKSTDYIDLKENILSELKNIDENATNDDELISKTMEIFCYTNQWIEYCDKENITSFLDKAVINNKNIELYL